MNESGRMCLAPFSRVCQFGSSPTAWPSPQQHRWIVGEDEEVYFYCTPW